MFKLKVLCISTALILIPSAGNCQTWVGVLDPSRAIDWSHAGAPHIGDARTQCVTAACNTVAGGTVTSSSLDAAVTSAPANTYILIPSGTYTISSGILVRGVSNVTLRGSGSNSTFLKFTGAVPSGCASSNTEDICVGSTDSSYWGSPSNSANFSGTNGTTGTYTRGATSIILSSVTNLSVGSLLILDQIDDQTDGGGLTVGCEYPNGTACSYSGTAPSGYQRGIGSNSTIRGQQQIVTVTSISGSTVGISPGLYAGNWSSGKSPGAWWPTQTISNIGIENMSLDHTNGGTGILFYYCTGCWVKDVRSVRSSTTGTGWYHVGMQMSNMGTVRDSYFYGYDGDAYGVESEIASDWLVENNIFQRPANINFNSDCEGCVVDYNFGANPVYTNSSNWLNGSQFYHSIMLFLLNEGNIGAQLYADSFHGTHVLDTQFRNRWDGREQNNGTATTSGTVALRLNPGARYQNAIGNVLGTPGYHTVYKAASNASNVSNAVVVAGAYPEGSAADPNVNPTAMFWGNWDSVTNAVRWCGNSSDTGWATTCGSTSEVPSSLSSYANPIPSTTTLPASFVYSSQPSWWPSGKAWPAIGPDVTGGNVGQCSGGTYDSSEATASSQCTGGAFSPVAGGRVVSIPAMDCYLNMMGGNPAGTGAALTFDANACYGSPTSANVNPPTGPTVVVR